MLSIHGQIGQALQGESHEAESPPLDYIVRYLVQIFRGQSVCFLSSAFCVSLQWELRRTKINAADPTATMEALNFANWRSWTRRCLSIEVFKNHPAASSMPPMTHQLLEYLRNIYCSFRDFDILAIFGGINTEGTHTGRGWFCMFQKALDKWAAAEQDRL